MSLAQFLAQTGYSIKFSFYFTYSMILHIKIKPPTSYFYESLQLRKHFLTL